MDDFFLNSSSFRPLGVDPPQCFLDLQPILAARLTGTTHPETDLVIALAANVCRRLADIVLYAGDLTLLRDKPKDGGHLLIGSRLVGFYSCCKALLDAAAIALTALYALQNAQGSPLAPKQQDFGKGAFWTALQTQHPDVFARYDPLRPTFGEIILWRDAIVHRVSPIVVTSFGRNPDTNVLTFLHYAMALDPEASFEALRKKETDTVPPTYHYDRWRPDLLRLCEELCRDIAANATSMP